MKKRVFLLLSICFIHLFAAEPAFAKKNSRELCEKLTPILKEGDLFFIQKDNAFFHQVNGATKTWASHLGIVIKMGAQWMVAESTLPKSQTVAVCDFFVRGDNNAYAIRRLKSDLRFEEIEKIKLEAKSRMNIPYDLRFDYDSKKQYCSKFVYDIYKQVTGLEIGKIETLADIRDNNPDFDQTFFAIWFGGEIPWNQRIVTPASQYRDERLVTVVEDNHQLLSF